MKKIVVMATLIGLFSGFLLCGSALAESDPYEMIDNLDISAVKSLQVRKSGNSYYLDMVVQMRNANERDIKLSECDFGVKLGSSVFSPRYIGKTTPQQIVINSAMTDSAPSTDVNLQIGLGADQANVLSTLTYVMNIVGNPADKTQIILDGGANASLKGKRGWIEKTDPVRIAEWQYSPKIQKELLLE